MQELVPKLSEVKQTKARICPRFIISATCRSRQDEANYLASFNVTERKTYTLSNCSDPRTVINQLAIENSLACFSLSVIVKIQRQWPPTNGRMILRYGRFATRKPWLQEDRLLNTCRVKWSDIRVASASMGLVRLPHRNTVNSWMDFFTEKPFCALR